MALMYSPQVLDHFQQPRNVGELAGASARVEIENPACGDILRLEVKVAEGRIAAARYRAKGCVPAIACGSKLTEMIQGRSLAEAAALTREELVRELGGLPEASSHASHLAMEALAALLKKLATD
jgi:nitrogen fixation NifU-like protein